MESTEHNIRPLATELADRLPGALPGVKLIELPFCHWLAMCELHSNALHIKDDTIYSPFVVAMNKALDVLADRHDWYVAHHSGGPATVLVAILEAMAAKTGYALQPDPTMFWGIAQAGEHATFVHMRRGDVPAAFLPPV